MDPGTALPSPWLQVPISDVPSEKLFDKILIANRGEIAVRILRACRDLRIPAVVAYSEADRETLAVRMADEAVCIGPAEARKSYLNQPAVVSAALITGCDAIHPGYGFLSEDAGFAEVVAAHDLNFIGPRAEVLERFGSKYAVRRMLAANGLPTVPGSRGIVSGRGPMNTNPERSTFSAKSAFSERNP